MYEIGYTYFFVPKIQLTLQQKKNKNTELNLWIKQNYKIQFK